MGSHNPSAEMLRLAELYRSKTDGELLKLAGDLSELTDVAQQALRQEMASRHLEAEAAPPIHFSPAVNSSSKMTEVERQALAFEMAERRLRMASQPPPADDPESEYADDRELVEFMTVWCLEDALRVQRALDVADIPFFMGEEKATGVDGVTSNWADGVVVRVMRVGLGWARATLPAFDYRYIPESERAQLDQEDEAPDVCVCCPKCRSQEVVLEDAGSEDPAAVETAAQFDWTCVACGNQWRDEGIAACEVKPKIDMSEL